MSERSSGPGGGTTDGLRVHLVTFLASLVRAGYAEETQRAKRRAVVQFAHWMRGREISFSDLNEAHVAAFLSQSSRRRRKHPARPALHQFIEHLRSTGVMLPCRHSDPSPAEVLVRRYVDHLRDYHGLCPRSIQVYSPFVRAFILTQRMPECSANLDALAVRRYLFEHSRTRSVSVVKLLAAALRSFLRFCFFAGTTPVDLSTAVPPVRRWQLSSVPPFLSAEEVELAVATPDRSTKRGCRAAAMLLLLARLGLRAGEVVALELGDIHWNAGEILVRGKGRLHDRLPLLDDVGTALARYLREARGTSASRRVFLSARTPRVGLAGPTAVCQVAREALRRAGLRPAGRVGAHIFRHSLATQMIRRGASLGEIAQVLRHRSLQSTRLYTKVDLEALRGVALPWPSAEVRP